MLSGEEAVDSAFPPSNTTTWSSRYLLEKRKLARIISSVMYTACSLDLCFSIFLLAYFLRFLRVFLESSLEDVQDRWAPAAARVRWDEGQLEEYTW
jgi:formate-dependent nitrite reductase membrane component NrfD